MNHIYNLSGVVRKSDANKYKTNKIIKRRFGGKHQRKKHNVLVEYVLYYDAESTCQQNPLAAYYIATSLSKSLCFNCGYLHPTGKKVCRKYCTVLWVVSAQVEWMNGYKKHGHI